MMFSPRSFLVLTALTVLITPALATVNNVAFFGLGENDPGAAAGISGNTTTVDAVGNFDLTATGDGMFYSAITDAPNSTLSMDFTGIGGYTRSEAIVSLTTNWGIEAFVQSDTTNFAGASNIAFDGNSGGRGMGLYRIGGEYVGLIAGQAIIGATALTSDVTRLALVVSGSTSTFYVNNIARGTGPAPNASNAGDYFGIGNRPNLEEQFDGRVDQVRVFTFNPGEFDANTDLAVPEPGSVALLALGSIVFGFRRRR